MGLFDKMMTLAETLFQNAEGAYTLKTVNNVISFYGVKDGLGTSTVVASVATTLASNSFSVCVLDMDMHFPSQLRLLCNKKELEAPVSVTKMFLNINLDIAEILNDTKLPTLKVVSSVPWDKPTSFMEVAEADITAMIEQLSKLFDFVLIDLGGADIAYETTTAGFKNCAQLYTVVSPNSDIIEGTYKMFSFLKESKYYWGAINLIQNLVVESPIKTSKFKELGMNHLLDLPFSSEIIKLRYSDLLMVNTGIQNKIAMLYKNGIGAIAAAIQAKSDSSNYRRKEGDVSSSDIEAILEDPENEVPMAEISFAKAGFIDATSDVAEQPTEETKVEAGGQKEAAELKPVQGTEDLLNKVLGSGLFSKGKPVAKKEEPPRDAGVSIKEADIKSISAIKPKQPVIVEKSGLDPIPVLTPEKNPEGIPQGGVDWDAL